MLYEFHLQDLGVSNGFLVRLMGVFQEGLLFKFFHYSAAQIYFCKESCPHLACIRFCSNNLNVFALKSCGRQK